MVFAILFVWLYMPMFVMLMTTSRKNRELLYEDLKRINQDLSKRWVKILYLLHTDGFFRELFYYRLGPIRQFIVSWLRPSYSHFHICRSMKMDGGAYFPHPFATYIHAKRIGRNFSCRNCTTIGKTDYGNPVIGDNVSVGANCVIIGNITIGDNVVIGAGSVIVKDIPSNCVVAGVPARVIREL